jgi:quercetin dioxygenase-like cupin family protein
VRAGEYLYEIVGEQKPMRVGIVCATEMLTTAIVDLHPSQQSETIDHPGDKVLYCLAGRMNVYLPSESPNWWELNPGDSAYIPSGCRHSFFNSSDAMAKFLFSVAPKYR